MTVPTNTYQTYASKGIREDLSDIIWRISPTQTPFSSSISKDKCSNTYTEWQTQDLASVTANAQIEGDDATTLAATPTARLGNYTQIMTKVVQVSGTNRAVKAAGRGDELAYQMSLKSLEIRRDLEAALCSAANGAGGAVSNATTTATHAGSASAARILRGLEGWLSTNSSLGAGGVAPVNTMGSWTGPTDGTAEAFTETRLKSVLQKCYTEGGDPDMVLCGPSQKQVFSTFTGGNTRYDISEDKKVTAAVDVYISDFGQLKVVPTRFCRNRTVFVLETEKWALGTLRGFTTVDLAKTGDSDRKMIVTEATLISRQEKASGIVRDCN